MKLKRCGEASFLSGTVLLGLSTAMMSKAGFGLSMVVAPAYVLAQWLGFVSAGTMCYICQGLLIVATCIILRRFRLAYLFSFLSAVLFGLAVDFFSNLFFSGIADPSMALRIILFCVAIPINSLSIALLFHSYFPPQAPELFVKELSLRYGWRLYLAKYIYDILSCVLSIALSLLFFRSLLFIGVGTVICALVNGPLIGIFGKLLDKIAEYDALFPRIGRLFEEIGSE